MKYTFGEKPHSFSSLVVLFILLHILSQSNSILAQDTSKAISFPHHTGDMWEYFYLERGSERDWVDTVQNFTISDSTDSNGIIHLTQYGRSINPLEYPYLIRDTTKYWIDTVNNIVYGPGFENDSALVYKLDAELGDHWTTWIRTDGNEIFGYEMARVEEKWEGRLFGIETVFMTIAYYFANESTEPLGLARYGDKIADGFGLIWRGGGESAQQIGVIGAIIDGILLGDTTLVSVKKNSNFLPSVIKLFQNYPNPFNPSTTIAFELSHLSEVSLTIYDVLGNKVKGLIENELITAGKHTIVWNGTTGYGNKVASGIYFYRLVSENKVLSLPMILLK